MGCCCSITLHDLIVACESGTIVEIERLLSDGFDVNCSDSKFIFKRNALGGVCPGFIHWWKNDGRYFYGMSVLCTAIQCGRDFEIIKLLLARGADPNGSGNSGFWNRTPVQWACGKKRKVLDSVELLKLLFAAGARDNTLESNLDPTVGQFWSHDSALRLAIQAKDYACVEYLITVKGMNVKETRFREVVSDQDGSYLMTAITTVEYDIPQVERFIQWGADVHGTSKHGMTALFYCTSRASAALLVDHGISIDHRNEDGVTALHYTVTHAYLDSKLVDLCVYLISVGADIHNKDKLEVGMLGKLGATHLELFQTTYQHYRNTPIVGSSVSTSLNGIEVDHVDVQDV